MSKFPSRVPFVNPKTKLLTPEAVRFLNRVALPISSVDRIKFVDDAGRPTDQAARILQTILDFKSSAELVDVNTGLLTREAAKGLSV